MRSSGVLMHISSLSTSYGIGTMGQSAREFVDFLQKSKQRYWQILPICPTGYGDSPYQTFSTFAGNPYFIDLDMLEEAGLLQKSDYDTIDWGKNPQKVDFGLLYEKRYPILHKAAKAFLQHVPDKYFDFCTKQSFWLDDYALFMTLKQVYGGKAWQEWPQPLKNREVLALDEAKKQYCDEISFWKVLQYLFYEQWTALQTYANERDILIIGDLPIYVALDSADVWANPEEFQLNEQMLPVEVAGCPPDGFSAKGQIWGNPLYDWDKMEQEGFWWWIRRIAYLTNVYNVLRIDHFRGFDSYFAIPYGSDTAATGHWCKGPGMKLFDAVEQAIGRKEIIAEDLGFLTDSVKQLLHDSGFPGMKVLQFAFDSRDANSIEYFPHNYTSHCVAYVGTHDNDTVQGWIRTISKEDANLAKAYLPLTDPDMYHWEMICALFKSVAELAIVQAQDLLGLGSEGRMNTPSTSDGNWQWRAKPDVFTDELAQKLLAYTTLFGRV